jgi:DNA processing protein
MRFGCGILTPIFADSRTELIQVNHVSDSKRFWVGFNLVKGIGAVRLRALLQAFGDLERAWLASARELQAAGLSSKLVESLVKVRSEVSLDAIWERIQNQGIQVLTWEDEGYPRRLKEIDQPPPVIYVRGRIQPEDDWAVAVVGTRRVSAYGRQVTEEIASLLARSGVSVVSGLARGVDAAAHQAALNAGGRTLAVLGSGVDRIYPPEHRRLAEAIQGQGAVISDYPPGTPPDGVNFPPRNRIISGLSLAVVIIEAGERSGALITAGFAADQGRDVFAVPGSILAPQSIGTNRLIQNGARPLLDPKEILEVLDLTLGLERREARQALPSDPTEAQLIKLLGREPVHVDDLRAQAGMPIEQVTATLTMMELKGMVKQVGSMHYVAVGESRAAYSAGE